MKTSQSSFKWTCSCANTPIMMHTKKCDTPSNVINPDNVADNPS